MSAPIFITRQTESAGDVNLPDPYGFVDGQIVMVQHKHSGKVVREESFKCVTKKWGDEDVVYCWEYQGWT